LSQVIFDILLILHIVTALAWLGALFAGLFPALKLYGPSSAGDAPAFRRGMMLRRLISGVGGLAVLFGIILLYYISAVDKSLAPSSTGLPILAAGALLGLVAFALSMMQTRPLQRAFEARIEQQQSPPPPQQQQAQPSSPSSSARPMVATTSNLQARVQKLPPKGLVISTPVILLVALVLMVAGSMM
jgi:uncharacterized membrane protein